jgi:beta-glucosidase
MHASHSRPCARPARVGCTALAALAAAASLACGDPGAGDGAQADPAPLLASADPFVESLLRELSLEEKIGQMTMLTLGALARRDPASGALQLDEAAVEKALAQYGIGAIFNTADHALAPEDWQRIVRQLQRAARGRGRHEIPLLYALDAVHGANYTQGAALFPHNIGLAAARDPELVQRLASATAASLRRDGITWTFGPVVDVGRQPLWPRLEETFGEDVTLVAELAAASVRGHELATPALATSIKHFVGHGTPRSGLDKTPSYIPDVQLYELELPPFRAGIAAGAASVMLGSGELNGTPLHASPHHLQDILRRELGFAGVILSNWAAIQQLHSVHRVAAAPSEAVRLAIDAGVDMAMVPLDYSVPDLLLELVREGRIPPERIDASVRRILNMKRELGLFENSDPVPSPRSQADDLALALEAALASITLLKNEPLATGSPALPLREDTRLLAVGPGCDSLPALHGGWSYSWTGEEEVQYPESTFTLLEALRERLPAARVDSIAFDFASESIDEHALAERSASADTVLLCLGEPASAEYTGNLQDLELPKNQLALARAAARSGKPLILVLLQGRPRLVREIEPLFSAIVLGYRPGSEGARALTRVLFGEHNPSGRLPYTYPRASGPLVLHDLKPSEARSDLPVESYGYQPQWPFGHGLSYTTYRYSDLRVTPLIWDGRSPLQVRITAHNGGLRPGTLVTELYTRDLYASLTPPERRLRRFTRTELAPGSSRELRFELTLADLSFIGIRLEPLTEPGEFEILIGDQRQRFEYRPPAAPVSAE